MPGHHSENATFCVLKEKLGIGGGGHIVVFESSILNYSFSFSQNLYGSAFKMRPGEVM